MQRRKFLTTSTALLGALPFIPAHSFNSFKTTSFMDAEIVKIQIGKINCTFFRDLMFKYLAKDFFINANREELDQSLHKYHIAPDNIPSLFIALLLQYNDKKVLIDTGVGFSEKPIMASDQPIFWKGRLQQLLQQENIKKEEITDVIITHFHPDHIGGVYSDDGLLNFPKARFHTNEDEWNYWHSSASDNQPELFKNFIEKNVTKLKDLDLQFCKGDSTEILPGITAIKVEGHTPGQIALDIHSGNEHLLYIADAFLHPLHIEKLDWQTIYDHDHEKAKQSRIKLLELAYKNNMLVNAFHFDFPGLGRIDKLNDNWAWKYTDK
ncbi:MAG: MBL fold metallo-hydrolase [Bacteroidota bacterium]